MWNRLRFLAWVVALLLGVVLVLIIPYSKSSAGDSVLLFLGLTVGVGVFGPLMEWVRGVMGKSHAVR